MGCFKSAKHISIPSFSTYLQICDVRLKIHVPTYLRTCIPMYLFIYPSACLDMYLFIDPSYMYHTRFGGNWRVWQKNAKNKQNDQKELRKSRLTSRLGQFPSDSGSQAGITPKPIAHWFPALDIWLIWSAHPIQNQTINCYMLFHGLVNSSWFGKKNGNIFSEQSSSE